ncbi:hypothetical protein [Helicobacter mesocricetorum]|uniref:hypothetical protein n=1 Tax=Helicobacter mesocricetorum TaxID=87012 RepID=UPI000CF19601|nr:hypothetical protein [Helicobacter mesocricetorum]
MEELDKLRQIGAREIAKNTHMALNKIEDILNLNFENLKDRATTIGLIKILEREYNIQLQKWVQDYNEFWASGVYQEEELTRAINVKITHEAVAPNSSMKVWFIIGFILLIVGVGFYIYSNFIFSQEVKFENALLGNSEENITSVDSVTLNENNTQPDTSSSTYYSQDSLEVKGEELSTSAFLDEEMQSNEEAITPKKVEIKPLSNIWVGIIYLDTKQKMSLMTDKTLEIDTTRPQTIITGHGMLEVDNNQEVLQYNLADKMRFYVDDEGNFSEINNTQYRQYNGGMGW